MSNSISVDFFKILTCSCHFSSNFDISAFMNSSCLEFCSSISIESEDNLSLETWQKLTFTTSYTNLCKLLHGWTKFCIVTCNNYTVINLMSQMLKYVNVTCYNLFIARQNLPADHSWVCLFHWEDNPEKSWHWGVPSPGTTARLALWGCCQHSQTNPRSFVCWEPPDQSWNCWLHWAEHGEVESCPQCPDQKNSWPARWRKQI